MKLRSKETAPLSHESLDENFTNLANKVNQILGLNIDEVTISSAGVISPANLGISAGSGITYSASGVIGHQARPAAQSGWSTGDLGNVSRRYVSGLDFDSFGHVAGYRYATINFTGSGSVAVYESSANHVTISSSAYTSGSSPNFTNITGNQLTIGSGIQLKESTYRADLLEIKGLTSEWAGISITNNTSEHLFALMADNSKFGLYDHQQNEWAWQYVENAGHEWRHNNAIKLATSTTGVTVTGTCTANAFSGDGSGITNVNAQLLDGIDGSSLVRSNANDTVTGLLTLNLSGECLRVSGSTATSSPYITFYQQGTRKAFIQFNDNTDNLHIYNDVYDDYLKIGNGSNGLKWNYSGTDYTVYHSGNLPSMPSVSSSSQYILTATGDYGTVRVDDNRNITWAGYAIRGDWVFMSSGADACGVYNDTDNEWATLWRRGGETELFHNGVMKFETTSTGAAVSGTLSAGTVKGTSNIRADDNVEIIMGSGSDFQMYHNGENAYFRNYNHNDGNIYFQGENTSGTNKGLIYMYCDTSRPYVRLFENGEEKLKTTSTGVTIGGEVETNSGTAITSQTGSGYLIRQDYVSKVGYWGSDNDYEFDWWRNGDEITIRFKIVFDDAGGLSGGGYYGFGGLPYTPKSIGGWQGRPIGTYGRMTRLYADPRLVTIQSGKLYIWGGSTGLPSLDEPLEGQITYTKA